MVWFKVDDRFHGSDPVKRIPRERRAAAIGLWTLAGTWSSQFLKDGFVPGHMIEDFGGSDDLAECLIEVGLWRRKRDGFQFVDWAKWQRTRAKIEDERKSVLARVAAHRAKKADKPENTGGSNADVTRYTDDVTPPQTRPDQTRPDQTVSMSSDELIDTEGGRAKRGTRIPDDFTITTEMVAWAREHTPLVDGPRATEMFVNYWRAATGRNATKLDWPATWRNWMLKDQQSAERVPQRRQTPEERMRATLALVTDLKEIS